MWVSAFPVQEEAMRTKGGEGRLRWEERRKDENDHPREGREGSLCDRLGIAVLATSLIAVTEHSTKAMYGKKN